jgi:ATP-dependent protease Clp ATPase subunit
MSATAESLPKTATSPGSTPPSETLYCSFCFKSQHHVLKLISGPASVFICNECVELCNGVIADRPIRTANSFADQQIPTERLLERLQAIEGTLKGKGSQLQQVVELLRSREVSWAVVGAALGVSRQAAWERFT